MNTHFPRLLKGLFVAALLTLSSPLRAATTAANLNLAALDQILAAVPPGQKLATVGDMQIPVANLTAWRNQLAGTPSPQSAFDGATPTWTAGNIYYQFSTTNTNAVPSILQKAFLDAAAEWAMFANLHFIVRTNQTNYVTVQVDPSLEGGQSAVGMVGGQQFLSVSPNAWNRGTLCHEIGHLLGLIHEHQRSDRDSFVTIISNNVVPGGLANFILLTNSLNQGPYDFLSVMHYARNYLSVSNNLDTIVPLPAFTQFINLMGQPGPVTLSAGDRAGMALIYGPAAIPITSVVTNTRDSGPGSLRAALYFAFDHPRTRITFNIATNDPGYTNGVFTIQPSDQLPSLVNATTIEGASQPTTKTNGPTIQINGANAPIPSTFANGLRLAGTNCTVHALTINGFAACSMDLDTTNSKGNTVAGCFLGIDSSGAFAITNGLFPLVIQNGASFNTIGGTVASNRNIISGSSFQGVALLDPATQGNVIQGNWIGLNAAGTAAISNGGAGIGIYNGTHGNLIGGGGPGTANVLSGNGIQGIALRDPATHDNSIVGNLIGLNPAGTAAISNLAGIEIFLGAYGNFIGAPIPGGGNIISGNTLQGILIDGSGTTNNDVEGNLIGLNAAGTAPIPNGGAGIGLFSGAQNNFIGNSDPASRNIISGNTLQGVVIGNPGTSGNLIQGNYIGLNPSGTAALPNNNPGVNIFGGATGNTIGGLDPGVGNIISGNNGQGVSLQDSGTSGNLIQGNFIGLNAAGNAAVPNTGVGLEMFFSPSGNTVSANVISGNNDDGVLLDNGASANNILANLIGLDATGAIAIPNAGSGVEMFVNANNNVIGGGPGSRNYISGNSKSGILIDDGVSGEIVQGNTIGLNVSGAATPNLNAGVGLFGGVQNNIIGGILPGQANLIADNAGGGVELYDSNTTNNTIRGNSIYGNQSGFGIFLYLANNATNEAAPTIVGVANNSTLTITGNIITQPNTAFHLDFYANPPSSIQATTYIGSHDINTDPRGTASFTFLLPTRLPTGYNLTATATDASGNTSQLSDSRQVSTADSVGDGIPDDWRETYFFLINPMTTNSDSCATCDPDHDGYNNLQEYLAGTVPTDAGSKLTSGSVAVATNGLDLTISFPTVSALTYRVEYKPTVTATNWTLLADQLLATGDTIQLTDPHAAANPQRYYRVTVVP